MKDFAAMNAIYARYFAALPKDALVEIKCIAKEPLPHSSLHKKSAARYYRAALRSYCFSS